MGSPDEARTSASDAHGAPAAGQRHVFLSLDLLRGVAALAVVALHLGEPIARYVPRAHLAVDLFFILSGVVVSHAYHQRIVSRRLNLRAFLVIRLIRLYPLYLLGTVATFLLIAGAADANPVPIARLLVALIPALLFLPTPTVASFGYPFAFPFNFPSWSLFWEIAVNIAYAIVARWLTKWLLMVIIACGAALLFFSSATHHGLDTGMRTDSFLAGGQRILYSFFAGVGIDRLRCAGRLPRIGVPAWLAALILIATFMPALSRGSALYDAVIVVFGYPLLVIGSLQPTSAVSARICSVMGLASYGIYTLQMPLLLAVGPQSDATIQLTSLVLITVIALTASRIFDEPVRRLLAKAVRNRRRSEA